MTTPKLKAGLATAAVFTLLAGLGWLLVHYPSVRWVIIAGLGVGGVGAALVSVGHSVYDVFEEYFERGV